MGKDIIESIKAEIWKSGFPLELFVLDICSKKNTGRMPNRRYLHEGILRELDLHAFFEEIKLEPKKGENLQHTTTDMIIACKTSRGKPWVFFSSKRFKHTDTFIFLKYVSDFDIYFGQNRTYPLLAHIHKNLSNSKKVHFKDKEIPRCLTYLEAFKNPSPQSDIYKAIDSVLSFYFHEKQRLLKNREEFGFFTAFFLPIIVFDGLLYEAQVEVDEVEIIERKHIQLRTDYGGELFVIDVVKKEYFEDFLGLIEQDHLEFVRAIDKLRFSEEHLSEMKAKEEQERKNYLARFPADLYFG